MHETTWYSPPLPLILASQSDRRKEILTKLGLTFSVMTPLIENEDQYLQAGNLESSLQNLASAKADSIAVAEADSLILGTDTIVVYGDTMLGKPKDRNDAAATLRLLSGKTHRVLSGVAILCRRRDFKVSGCQETEVSFRKISDDEIERYLSLNEYADKAGSYGIQGSALSFISEIRGCYYNVMGLPVSLTLDLLTLAAEKIK